MRALAYFGPGRVKVVKKPDPRIEHPQDVVLRVTRAAICGSDLHLLHGLVPDFRIPEHHPEHWMLLLAADRLEVRLTRARRWLAFAAGALAAWAALRAIEER